jgi:hypothetical protein
MKTNGATWKAYIASWPEGQWFDDSDETFDGISGADYDKDPPDDAVVVFTYGVVYATREDRDGKSLVSHFRAWLKAQTHTNVVCQVPNAKLEEFEAFLKTIGAKALQ